MSAARTGPGLTVAAVAHRLGVAPATLRTWDRRYGLGPSEHQSGSHRRYSPHDVARLEVMRRLVVQGVSPADAAQEALTTTTREDRPTATPSGAPDLEGAVRGLSRAALALDVDAVVDGVGQLLAEHGVVATWERALVPVLVGAGVRWETTGEGIDVEHLLCRGIETALQRYATAVPQAPRPVLLACAPDDQHELPLRVLAGALAEAGHGSRLLGASVPREAMRAAVKRTGAAVLVVWSQRPATADTGLLDLPATRPPTSVLVGGPGWPEQLPPGVARAGSLGVAVSLVEQALRGKPIASRG